MWLGLKTTFGIIEIWISWGEVCIIPSIKLLKKKFLVIKPCLSPVTTCFKTLRFLHSIHYLVVEMWYISKLMVNIFLCFDLRVYWYPKHFERIEWIQWEGIKSYCILILKDCWSDYSSVLVYKDFFYELLVSYVCLIWFFKAW